VPAEATAAPVTAEAVTAPAAIPSALDGGPVGAPREEKTGIFAGHKRADVLQQEISDLARENERLRQQATAQILMILAPL
jgi:hypothetical protein